MKTPIWRRIPSSDLVAKEKGGHKAEMERNQDLNPNLPIKTMRR